MFFERNSSFSGASDLFRNLIFSLFQLCKHSYSKPHRVVQARTEQSFHTPYGFTWMLSATNSCKTCNCNDSPSCVENPQLPQKLKYCCKLVHHQLEMFIRHDRKIHFIHQTFHQHTRKSY